MLLFRGKTLTPDPMKRKLRFGMVGGGRGAFIGAVHRIVAIMDGRAELAAGAFSSQPERSRASGAELGLPPDRVYGRYEDMAAAEAQRAAAERLDFVVIVTPNDQHFPAAKRFLEAGFHVVCDKPLTLDLAEAKALRAVVKKTRKIFVLTHNYTGNAMVKEARDRVRRGALGPIRKVVVEYSQGWLSTALEKTGHKQASWRADPKRSGLVGCMGDIGTHAENLARYITGLRIEALCAEFTTFVPGRLLEDDANILLRYVGGAKGVMHASQICVGEENNLTIRVYGTKASLEWHQEHPNELIVKYPDRPREILRRGNAYLGAAAKKFTRIPAGHPEGYLEAFANIYLEALRAIEAECSGRPIPKNLDFPTIEDGVYGMAFIESAVKSARAGGRWTTMRDTG
jgi:predicted dehydrogenase